jgi:hypothetical protein
MTPSTLWKPGHASGRPRVCGTSAATGFISRLDATHRFADDSCRIRKNRPLAAARMIEGRWLVRRISGRRRFLGGSAAAAGYRAGHADSTGTGRWRGSDDRKPAARAARMMRAAGLSDGSRSQTVFGRLSASGRLSGESRRIS